MPEEEDETASVLDVRYASASWEPLVALNTWCGLHVIQDIRYYETSPSHLHHISVDKQLLPKKAYSSSPVLHLP
jgi:hypothetical protein